MEEYKIIATKNKIVNIALFWFSVISIPVVYFSVNRWQVTGWIPVYFVQIGFTLSVILLFFLRNRIEFKIKASLFCLIYGITGITSFYAFGLIANGVIVLISVSLFSSLFFNIRIGLISTGILLVSIIIVGFLYVSGFKEVSFNVEDIFYSYHAWINAFSLFILNTVTLIFSQDFLSKTYKETIHELTEAKEILNDQNVLLKELNEEKETLLNKNSHLISQLKTIVNHSLQSVLLLDLAGTILLMDKKNKRVVMELWNLHHEKINFREIFNSEVLKVVEEKFYEALNGNITRFEFKHILPAGKSAWIDAEFFPVVNKSNEVMSIVYSSVDVTDRKMTAVKVLHSAIQAEEKERRRVAQELHDGLGPLLSTLKLYYESQLHTSDQTLKEKLKTQISDSIEDALDQVSSISNNISPHILVNFGLKSALERFIMKVTKLGNLTFDYNIEEIKNLNKEIEITLYRVITELINNTLKYANANIIKLNLKVITDKISLEYLDNGTGFDFKKVIDNKDGMGLFNLKNRIESFNGSIKIQSQTEKGGVHYIISLPLVNNE